MIHSYKDLVVWQKAFSLTLEIYKATSTFPKEELYGLTSQMRRAAISIPSNIAEGRHRGTRKDFAQFLRIALGSCAELQTQVEISKSLGYIKQIEYIKNSGLLDEVSKMINVMIRKLTSDS